MFFDVNKCKSLHISKENPKFDYQMEDKDNTYVVYCEKDIGIYVEDSLKFDMIISKTVNRANRLVGLIKRVFFYQDEGTSLHVVLYNDLTNFASW